MTSDSEDGLGECGMNDILSSVIRLVKDTVDAIAAIESVSSGLDAFVNQQETANQIRVTGLIQQFQWFEHLKEEKANS